MCQEMTWKRERTVQRAMVGWSFTTEDARTKLRRVYLPKKGDEGLVAIGLGILLEQRRGLPGRPLNHFGQVSPLVMDAPGRGRETYRSLHFASSTLNRRR